MFDHNGLELSPVAESMNAYKMTAVSLTRKKFSAYANAKPRFKNEFAMYSIGMYNDPRDAAYVAQEFAKQYTPEQTRQMVIDGSIYQIAKEFRENIEIPEWKFSAEGLTINELINGGYEMFNHNYVDNAKDALIEAIKVYNKKTPALNEVKKIMETIEKLHDDGETYRNAAKEIVSGFQSR
jgi:hypothetical protein